MEKGGQEDKLILRLVVCPWLSGLVCGFGLSLEQAEQLAVQVVVPVWKGRQAWLRGHSCTQKAACSSVVYLDKEPISCRPHESHNCVSQPQYNQDQFA